jgi:hypothetical protein
MTVRLYVEMKCFTFTVLLHDSFINLLLYQYPNRDSIFTLLCFHHRIMLSHGPVLLITTTTIIPYNNASAMVSRIYTDYIITLHF